MVEISKELLAALAKIEPGDLDYFGATDHYRNRTTEVIMNDAKIVEVGPEDEEQTIGTSSLGGCLGVAVVVEHPDGKRRCGLAHYDPMYLKLELERNRTPESIARMFGSAAQMNKDKLSKRSVIVMSTSPDEHQRDIVDSIKREAHYLLDCDDVVVIKYGEHFSDSLDVTIPNKNSGSPSYKTRSRSESLNW